MNKLRKILRKILYKKILKFYLIFKSQTLTNNTDKKFNKIQIDTSDSFSELCKISKNLSCDKSIFNQGARHSYTSIYDLLFHQIKNERLTFGEIGILKNESIKLFREYFLNANIIGFEYDQRLINSALKDELNGVEYIQMDVSKRESIRQKFSLIKDKFDILIDDSTHEFKDQINIINEAIPFIKSNGFLIIEDIYEYYNEERYFLELKHLKKYFSKIYFIKSKNKNNITPIWDNSKLLVLVRNYLEY